MSQNAPCSGSAVDNQQVMIVMLFIGLYYGISAVIFLSHEHG